MERFFEREKKIDIVLTPEASKYLEQLMRRPNPNLAEFAFLGLGKGNTIDQILAIDEDLTKRELDSKPPHLESKSLIPQFAMLGETKRINDFLLFGHSHPIGIKRVDGKYQFVAPTDKLLLPSMGTRAQGGPTTDMDIGFFKWLYQSVVNVPYVGITTPNDRVIKLRIYKTEELISIHRARDIYHVPQITMKL